MSSPTPLIHHAVRAGAGAGKTYHLTHKVMDVAESFFNQFKRWPTLQVTTFTRKATQELGERLLRLALEEKPHLVDFATSKNILRVNTIDAILDHFLKNHGSVIGLASDFSYLSAADAKMLSKKTLKRMIESDSAHQKLLSYYSFYQLLGVLDKAVHKDLSDYKVIDVLLLQNLLKQRLFKMREDVIALVEKIQSVSLAEKWSEVEQSLSQIALLLTEKEWNSAKLQDILDRFVLTGLKSKKDPASLDIYPELKDVIDRLWDFCKPAYHSENYAFHEELNRWFFNLLRDYKAELLRHKKEMNKIQIADLTTLSLQIIREHSEVAKLYSDSIDYWLIDEFQDTSPVQIEILDALMGSKPFYFVGDPQQSIYLFRGARSSVFLDRIAAASESQGKIEVLDSNYRSEPALLSLINDLSQELGTGFAAMNAALPVTDGDSPAAVFTVVHPADENLDPDKLEVDSILRHIRELSAKGVDYANVAILVRKNEQLQMLSQALTQWQIPHLVHSTGSYWLRREVQDAISLLKAIINPYDDNHLAQFLRSPYLAIPEQKLIDIMSGRKKSLWDVVATPLADGSLGKIGQKFMSLLQTKNEKGIVACLQACLLSLGFFDTHLLADEGGRVEGNLWKFIDLISQFERERGANLIKFINDCQRAAELEGSKDLPSAIESQRINLMTIHASKGLQFDHVFLPFLSDDPYQKNHDDFILDEDHKVCSIRTPVSQSDLQSYGSLLEAQVLARTHQKEAEESLRVFYVGFTRAKKSLYLSWSGEAGARSSARFLTSFVAEEGLQERNGYQFVVEKVIAEAEVQCQESVEKKISLRPPFKKEWMSHTVTESASEPHKEVPSYFESNSYRNSFVNKRRGILFHRIMETLKYSTSLNMVELIDAWFPGEEDTIAEAINYIVQQQNPPLVKLIKQGEVEWSFAMKSPERDLPIEGQIDLWGIVDGKLWIVDYKSGSKVLKDKALKQLHAYAVALKGYLSWQDEIHLAVVYPFLNETHTEVLNLP